MTTALVGHTGFVGETLKRQATFDALFRSTDIHEMANRSFDLVVCAGAPAAKWIANREPQADADNLDRLMGHLATVETRRFILVSTVDVYADPTGADEDAPISPDPRNAYGRNRLRLEKFCQERFAASVVRLPALFGRGLRKNAIYDLLHENNVDQLQPRSWYQYYDMGLVWSDLLRIEGAKLKLVNLVTEPVELGAVAEQVFGRTLPPHPTAPPARYDLRTRHAACWGRRDGYAYGAAEILARLQAFVRSERGQEPSP